MIQHLTDRVSVVFTEDGFTSGNCILVEDDVRLMIDSGCGRELDSVRPEAVELLLCSHHHVDHIGGNDRFVNARILAHPLEAAAMQVAEKLIATDRWQELMDEENFFCVPEVNGAPNRLYLPWRVDGPLAEGQVVDCGATRIGVIHTPGHTAGHCSFHLLDDDIVFIADICLSKVGPWYGGRDSGIDAFIASIDRIIDMKPATIVTGHLGSVLTENIPGVLGEYRGRILNRESRILAYVRDHPSTINELAQRHFIYPAHPSLFVLYWEKSMLHNHLDRLIALGEVARYDDGRYGPARVLGA
ncbi:MAG TPA: MBL fold metallo-hydrolase [Spirochaetota bacterium]|nr:MBL fold metallo-hydrolase [Spirochaetota bacterium]HNT10146.1 MBL fold metallo-hydrolase [Spirochaetota bacterium]